MIIFFVSIVICMYFPIFNRKISSTPIKNFLNKEFLILEVVTSEKPWEKRANYEAIDMTKKCWIRRLTYCFLFLLFTKISFPLGQSSIVVLDPISSTSLTKVKLSISWYTFWGCIFSICLQLLYKVGSTSQISSNEISFPANFKKKIHGQIQLRFVF